MNPVLWSPSPDFAAATNLARFHAFVRDRFGGPADPSYAALHRWRLNRRGAFWAAVWQFVGVIGEPSAAGDDPALAPGRE